MSTTLKEWLHGPGNRRREWTVPLPPLQERVDWALVLLFLDDVVGGEAVVEEVVAKVGSVVGATGGLDADVPEDLLVIGDDLEE